jgi:ADP-ribose pyrophosphatase
MAQRDVVVGPGAVVVVALDAEGRVLLVSPHPVGGSLVELPAGECIEDPLVAAGRSLGEQAGLRADTWHVLVDLLALPGGMAVSSRVYLARDLRPTPDTQRPREGAGTWVALDRAVDDVFADVLRDGVVAAGIIAAVQARDTFWGSLRPADLPWPPDISIGSSPSEHCSQ